MTARVENRMSNLTAILSLAITIIVAVVTFTIYSTRIDERSKKNETAIEQQRVTVTDQGSKIDEVRYNLRALMEAQGVKYQRNDK